MERTIEVSNSDDYNDVYVQCSAIQAKFRELREFVYNNSNSILVQAIAKMQLLSWFCQQEGFEQLRDYLCDVENNNAWGGQMELRLLANFWRVGVNWFRFNSQLNKEF